MSSLKSRMNYGAGPPPSQNIFNVRKDNEPIVKFYTDMEKQPHPSSDMTLKREFNPRTNTINDADRLYLEIYYPNNTTNDLPNSFNVQFNQPFITQPGDYNIIPLTFTVPSTNIPSAIIGQANSTGGMGVCLSIDGVNFTGAVNPINDDATSPNIGHMYNYQTIADSVNNAFASAFSSAISAGHITGATYGPYLTYDNNNFEYALNAQMPQFDYNTTGACQVWMNYEIAEDLQQIQYVFHGRNNPNFKDYQMKVKNNGGNVSVLQPPWPYITGGTGATCYSNNNTLYNFNPYPKLAILANGDNNVFSTNFNNLSGNGVPNTNNIIADFSLSSDLGYDTRGLIKYLPTAEFRRIPMRPGNPMSNFGFNVVFFDTNQNQIQSFNPPGTPSVFLWCFELKRITNPHLHYPGEFQDKKC